MIATRTDTGYKVGKRTLTKTSTENISNGDTLVVLEGKRGAAYLGKVMADGNVSIFYTC